MSEEPLPVSIPGPSKHIETDDGILSTPSEFSKALTLELTDDEIQKAFAIIVDIQRKYAFRRNTVQVLEELRDEITTRLAEVGVLVSVDPSPCFYGEPPVIDIIGKVAGDPIHNYGMDHEKKEWEVKRANERGEDFLGQKEKPSGKK